MEANQAYINWKERVLSGDKNIAISNVGHVASQQKYLVTILADLGNDPDFKNVKICLVSFNLQFGLYKDYVSNYKEFINNYFPENTGLVVVPNKMGSHFIDWNNLLLTQESNDKIAEYDLIFWDLPDLNFINLKSQLLLPYFKLFNSLLIVSLRPNGIDGNEYYKRISSFYNSHGLNLPTLISDHKNTVVKSRRMSDLIRKVVGF
ncbi:MAG: hypothetical protein Q7U04_07740 [Bacteriovorax sp.]|nr:hypothetical protein [Bacteriovorax sp.]